MNKLLFSIASLFYINLLPYVSRLPKGFAWAKQYLPDEGHLIGGLLFFHFFYSIPAGLLIFAIYTNKKPAIPLISTFLTVTIATILFNYGYDLASDAQAAIGLVFMPVYVTMLGLIAFAVGHALQFVVHKNALRAMHKPRESSKENSGR
jgi:hypothetical protein